MLTTDDMAAIGWGLECEAAAERCREAMAEAPAPGVWFMGHDGKLVDALAVARAIRDEVSGSLK